MMKLVDLLHLNLRLPKSSVNDQIYVVSDMAANVSNKKLIRLVTCLKAVTLFNVLLPVYQIFQKSCQKLEWGLNKYNGLINLAKSPKYQFSGILESFHRVLGWQISFFTSFTEVVTDFLNEL